MLSSARLVTSRMCSLGFLRSDDDYQGLTRAGNLENWLRSHPKAVTELIGHRVSNPQEIWRTRRNAQRAQLKKSDFRVAQFSMVESDGQNWMSCDVTQCRCQDCVAAIKEAVILRQGFGSFTNFNRPFCGSQARCFSRTAFADPLGLATLGWQQLQPGPAARSSKHVEGCPMDPSSGWAPRICQCSCSICRKSWPNWTVSCGRQTSGTVQLDMLLTQRPNFPRFKWSRVAWHEILGFSFTSSPSNWL